MLEARFSETSRLSLWHGYLVQMVGFWLYSIGRFDSQWIMAIFIFAFATLTALVQWLAADRQWRAMCAQNKIMFRQVTQTDAIIATVRAEQRLWLCLDSIHLDESDYRNLGFVMVAKNTGCSLAQKIFARHGRSMGCAWNF